MSTIFQRRLSAMRIKSFTARFSAALLAIIAASILLTNLINHPASAGNQAAGLRGEYFDHEDFTDLKLTRVDPTVDFNWRFGSPDPLIGADTFSIRWTGQITPPAAGNYTFVTRSDDGVRLTLNDQLLINNFTPHPETEDRSSPVALDPGQRHNIRLEYFELTANALIRLMWIRPGQTVPEIIPASALSPPPDPNPAPVLTSLSPATVPANSGAFTLAVNGGNFVQGAVVQWNNSPRPTTFVNGGQVAANIPASDLQAAGIVNITAVNPAPGGGTSNALQLTISGGFEADVAPRPTGNNNGTVTISDWTQLGRFSSGLDAAAIGNEFQRADCAPRSSLGDGRIALTDWVQAGRYASGLDPVTDAGGPTGPPANATAEPPPGSTNDQPEIGRSRLDDPRRVYALARTGDSIAIACDARGDENAFGFSLSFDPRQWQFVSAAGGVDARDAAIFVNARQTANGRVGLALALPPNRQLPAGARQIAVLTFRPRSANISPFPTLIDFADEPVAREAVDANAKRLSAIFTLDGFAFDRRAVARR